MPAKIDGSALGKRMVSSVFSGEARHDLARLSMSGSMDFSPSTVSITIGKIAIMMAMAIFGSAPVPIQITNSGASATLGTAFSETRIADSVRSRNLRIDDADRRRHAEHDRDGEAARRRAERERGCA